MATPPIELENLRRSSSGSKDSEREGALKRIIAQIEQTKIQPPTQCQCGKVPCDCSQKVPLVTQKKEQSPPSRKSSRRSSETLESKEQESAITKKKAHNTKANYFR